MERLQMITYEQIGVCYSACRSYMVAITYFKKGLHMAYLLND
jgi:hypothetical protein